VNYISPFIPSVKGSIAAHMRHMVCDAEIHELESKPEHVLTLMNHLHSAPVTLAPTLQSIHLQRGPKC